MRKKLKNKIIKETIDERTKRMNREKKINERGYYMKLGLLFL